jgi:hypothetical protein
MAELRTLTGRTRTESFADILSLASPQPRGYYITVTSSKTVESLVLYLFPNGVALARFPRNERFSTSVAVGVWSAPEQGGTMTLWSPANVFTTLRGDNYNPAFGTLTPTMLRNMDKRSTTRGVLMDDRSFKIIDLLEAWGMAWTEQGFEPVESIVEVPESEAEASPLGDGRAILEQYIRIHETLWHPPDWVEGWKVHGIAHYMPWIQFRNRSELLSNFRLVQDPYKVAPDIGAKTRAAKREERERAHRGAASARFAARYDKL